MYLSLPAVMDPRFEAALRQQCLSALDGIPTGDDTRPSAEDMVAVLRTGARLLELLVVVASTAEAVLELDIRSYGDVRRRAREVQDRVASATGIDVNAALQYGRELRLPSGEKPRDEAEIKVGLPRLVRAVAAVTASCPIDLFDDIAGFLTQPEPSYRCRVACEALRSFLRRHDPRQRGIVLAVGRHYQRGAIELDDVSELLGESPSDAIVLLEEHGFGRTVETLRLSEDQRRDHLSQIRRDRMIRSGKPAYSRDIVRRSTLASERIEGVDARSWLVPEPDRDRGR